MGCKSWFSKGFKCRKRDKALRTTCIESSPKAEHQNIKPKTEQVKHQGRRLENDFHGLQWILGVKHGFPALPMGKSQAKLARVQVSSRPCRSIQKIRMSTKKQKHGRHQRTRMGTKKQKRTQIHHLTLHARKRLTREAKHHPWNCPLKRKETQILPPNGNRRVVLRTV